MDDQPEAKAPQPDGEELGEATREQAVAESSALRCLMGGLGPEWVDLRPDRSDGSRRRTAVQRFLTDLLQSPVLVILAGLGTSQCIQAPTPAPTMDALWESAKELPGWGEMLLEINLQDDRRDIENLLSRCEMVAGIRPDSHAASFRRAAEHMIVQKCRFIDRDARLPHHEEFLRRVARRSTRLARTLMFTTNYDLAFETAAASLGFVILDGFSYTYPRAVDPVYFDYDFVRRSPTGTMSFVPEVFVLHKLHGSINWDASSPRIIQVEEPAVPALIFPRLSKYELSYERPFLESTSRFQSALRAENVGVLVVGFGMHDKHLVEPLLGSIRSNSSARLAVVDTNLASEDRPAFIALAEQARRGDPRLALVSGSFEDFVPMLPDLAPTSEAERLDRESRELAIRERIHDDAPQA